MCSPPENAGPAQKFAHNWGIGQIVWSIIAVVVGTLAGGWLGLAAGILLIVGASLILCWKDPRAYRWASVVSGVGAGIFGAASGLMFHAYYSVDKSCDEGRYSTRNLCDTVGTIVLVAAIINLVFTLLGSGSAFYFNKAATAEFQKNNNGGQAPVQAQQVEGSLS